MFCRCFGRCGHHVPFNFNKIKMRSVDASVGVDIMLHANILFMCRIDEQYVRMNKMSAFRVNPLRKSCDILLSECEIYCSSHILFK